LFARMALPDCGSHILGEHSLSLIEQKPCQ
jgi:hypothetical protein